MSAHNFEELQKHVGHEVKVVEYSSEYFVVKITVECVSCGDVLLEYENPIVTKIFASWLKTTFTIDGDNTFTGYYDKTDNLHDGWFAPAFEKDELMRWLEIELPGRHIFIEKLDAIRINQKGIDPNHEYIIGFNAETVDGHKHLYSPEGWNWDISKSIALCICGHIRGAHLSDGGGCSESSCKCQQFFESDD